MLIYFDTYTYINRFIIFVSICIYMSVGTSVSQILKLSEIYISRNKVAKFVENL